MRCSAFIVKPLFSFAVAALKAAPASEEQDYSNYMAGPQVLSFDHLIDMIYRFIQFNLL